MLIAERMFYKRTAKREWLSSKPKKNARARFFVGFPRALRVSNTQRTGESASGAAAPGGAENEEKKTDKGLLKRTQLYKMPRFV